MSNELDKLLYEIERRGNCITTWGLKATGILQYQRALGQLRDRVKKKGWELTYAEGIEGQKKNRMYRLIKPVIKQPELFVA